MITGEEDNKLNHNGHENLREAGVRIRTLITETNREKEGGCGGGLGKS